MKRGLKWQSIAWGCVSDSKKHVHQSFKKKISHPSSSLTANGYSDTTPPVEATPGKFPRMQSSFSDVTCSDMFVEMME